MGSDRLFIVNWWEAAWADGLWAAAWSKSVEGISPVQAGWRPPSAPGVAEPRHSVCQHVWHIVFWRESWLRRVAGGGRPTPEETARLNWREPAADIEDDWREARQHLQETQERIGALLKDPSLSDEHFQAVAYFVPHDCYHFGQINMIRGMLGMPPIE